MVGILNDASEWNECVARMLLVVLMVRQEKHGKGMSRSHRGSRGLLLWFELSFLLK